jgi:hypothetical protein
MPADRTFFVMGGACNWPVDIGELTAIFGIPFPDVGGGVFGKCLGHEDASNFRVLVWCRDVLE